MSLQEGLVAGMRAWHEAQKEKRKEYKRLWRLANRDKIAEYQSAWRKANRDKVNASNKRSRERKRFKDDMPMKGEGSVSETSK
jgi:hypothetical protein